MDDFGKLLQMARMSFGLSLSQLAEQTRVSKPFLSQLENRSQQLSFEVAILLAEVLRLDLNEMAEVFMDSRACRG